MNKPNEKDPLRMRALNAGSTRYDSTVPSIKHKLKKSKLNACIASLQLSRYEGYLILSAIEYIESMRLARWKNTCEAIEHSRGVLHRLGFIVGGIK